MLAPSVSTRTRSKPSNMPKTPSPKYTTLSPRPAYQSIGTIAARRLRTAKEALKEPEQSRPRLPQSASDDDLRLAARSAARSFALGALPFIRRAFDLDALGLPNRGSPLDRYLQDPVLKPRPYALLVHALGQRHASPESALPTLPNVVAASLYGEARDAEQRRLVKGRIRDVAAQQGSVKTSIAYNLVLRAS